MCPNCGNETTGKFCEKCGNPLEVVTNNPNEEINSTINSNSSETTTPTIANIHLKASKKNKVSTRLILEIIGCVIILILFVSVVSGDQETTNNDDLQARYDELAALYEGALEQIADLETEYINLSDTNKTLVAQIDELQRAMDAPEEDVPEEPIVEEVTPLTETPTLEVPAEGEQALRSGQQYLNFTSFSRSGLGEQLEYEGFPADAIEYALTRLDETVDWYEQAVLKAQQYLDLMSFSRSRLIDQLVYEGFTKDQAEHGANEALN